VTDERKKKIITRADRDTGVIMMHDRTDDDDHFHVELEQKNSNDLTSRSRRRTFTVNHNPVLYFQRRILTLTLTNTVKTSFP